MTPVEAAMAALEEDKKCRAEACNEKIKVALNEYRCTIDIQVVLRSGSITPIVQIIAET